MLFELIAVVVAGIAAGGLVTLLRRAAPAVPRWMVPVMAGAAMLTASISLEYSWFPRTRDALPEGLRVALTHESRAPWRPWTYAAPFVDRFIAVDLATMRTNEALPDQRMVDLYAFGRWAATQRVQTVADCATHRRADLAPGVSFADDGQVQGAVWVAAVADDPIMQTICAEE